MAGFDLERAKPYLVGNAVVLTRDELFLGTCQQCGRPDEDCRPYGEGRKWVCFACGEADPETGPRMVSFMIECLEELGLSRAEACGLFALELRELRLAVVEVANDKGGSV